jgi:hypothetical protein
MNMDKILSQRYIPQARDGLAEQIIVAAITGQGRLSLGNEILLWLMIPKPRYMMVLLLVIGVVLGAGTDDLTSVFAEGMQVGADEDTLFYMDEGWL